MRPDRGQRRRGATLERIRRGRSCLDLVHAAGVPTRRHSKGVVMRCLWHDDEHPSLYVYANGTKCFSCGHAGDVLDLYQALYKVTFAEAVAALDPEPPRGARRPPRVALPVAHLPPAPIRPGYVHERVPCPPGCPICVTWMVDWDGA